jgi:hypothetical protein
MDDHPSAGRLRSRSDEALKCATWQMIKLTVNGERVEDPKPMKMQRVKPEKS